MSKKGYELYTEQKYDQAFRRFTIYLKNIKKKDSKAYHETHKIIDTILENHQLSKDTLKWLEMYVSNGDTMIIMAKVYYFGAGVKRDYEKSVEWLKKVSNGYGIYLLGNMYSNGSGIKQDEVKAYELYKKSADMGNCKAQLILASVHRMEGEFDKAIAIYNALLTNGEARYCLGQMSELGQGLVKSPAVALIHYQNSYQYGNKKVINKIISMCELLNERNKAITLCEKVWKKTKDKNIHKKLGELYTKDILIKKKRSQYRQKAIEHYSALVDLGNIDAIFQLGRVYRRAYPINNPLYKKGLELFEKSAELGNSMAQFELGFHNYHGRIYKKNLPKARQWFEIASIQRNADATYFLGHMNIYEQGGKKNPKFGIELLNKSLNREALIFDEFSNSLLWTKGAFARLYSEGIYVKKDIYKAAQYYIDNKIKLINLLNDHADVVRDIWSSTYWLENINYVDNKVLSPEYKVIKRVVEGGTNTLEELTASNIIEIVKTYFKYSKKTRKEVCYILDKTTMYMPVLHSIIGKYMNGQTL
jgi:TPR repeat protein